MREVAASHVAEIERLAADYLGEPDDLEPVTHHDLAERLRRGDVTVVDVRPVREFAAGHIEGARSIPVEELEARLAEVPGDREVVAYCRGPYCVFADDAVRELKERGYEARRLEGGFPEWRRAGFPVEAEAEAS